MNQEERVHRISWKSASVTGEGGDLQKVDLGALSFDGTKVRAQPLDHPQKTITDITAKLVEPL